MSSGMPELGSKISLISKADIRYEGRLFTVDPQECTIALANVRSFGTEDRDTQFPVAPQNQVYEYILFRGSDIKDIRVVNAVSTLPNDPAIVQMTVPPALGQQSYQQQTNYSHSMMNPLGGLNSQYGTPYGISMTSIPPVMGLSNQNRQSGTKQGGMLDIINASSRATTPNSLLTRKSPTNDQVVQSSKQQTSQQLVSKMDEQPRELQSLQRERDSHASARAPSGLSQFIEGKSDGKSRIPQNVGNGSSSNQVCSTQNVRAVRSGWINCRPNIRGRGSRVRGHFRMNQNVNTPGKLKNTLKFDNDYDFEQANTEFEELRLQLAKTKIDTLSENEKKDDSGNETGAGDGEAEEDSDVVHYDKSKSFFDNISCEAVERSKGRSQRTDWRTERKLNSETFGAASIRRGNFRGRGYYPRGISGSVYRASIPSAMGGLSHTGFRGAYRATRANSRKINNNPTNLPQGAGNQAQAENEQKSESPSQQNNRLVTSTA